jgi:hypothetical protein
MNFLIFANCQGYALSKYIEYLGETVSVSYYPNYQIISRGAASLPTQFDSACRRANILLYQPLDQKWGIFSKPELWFSGQIIRIPYLYIDGLWPFYEEGKKTKGSELLDSIAMTPDSDKMLLLKNILNGSCNSLAAIQGWEELQNNLQNRLEASMNILSGKERSCDIKILNHLRCDLSTRLPMYTQNHPKPHILSRMFKEICNLLDLRGPVTEICSIFEQLPKSEAKDLLYQTEVEWPGIAAVPDLLGLGWDFTSVSATPDLAIDFYLSVASRYWTNDCISKK